MSLVPWWCLLYVIGCQGYVHKPASSWNVYQFHTYPHPAKKQVIPRDIMVNVINNLGLKLLAIHNEYNENNIAISPYGAVSVLIALGEGLEGDAVYEIQRAAQIPNDISVIRVGLRDIHRHLKSYFIPKEGFLAGLSLNHDNVTLRPEYEEILKFYGYDVVSFNSALYPDPETTGKPEITTKGEIITTEEHTTVESVATEQVARLETTTEQLTTERENILTTIVESTTKSTERTTFIPTTELSTSVLPETTITMEPKVEETTTAVPLSTTAATTTEIIVTTTEGTTTTEKVTTLDILTTSSPTTEVIQLDEIVTEPTTSNLETTTTIFTSQTVTTTETPISFISTVGSTLQTDTTEATSTDNIVTSPLTTTSLPTTLPTTILPVSESSTDNTTPLPIATTLELNADTQEVTSTLPSVTSDLPNTDSTTTTFETTTTSITTTTSSSTTLEEETSTITTPKLTTPILDGDNGDNEIDAPSMISEGFGGTLKRQALSEDINAVQLNVKEKHQSSDGKLKRNSRSIVDYLIARYYDDQFTSHDRGHYVPVEQPSFLVYGKYKEYNINFMKYDTVLPFHYVSHLKSLALSFPLDSTKYYLLLLLPENENGIDKLICDLRLNGSLKYIIENMRYTHVVATIPSFMLKGYVTLTPSFQKLGIRRVFEPRQADFSLMTSQRGIYVTNIEQAITVTIRNYVDPNSLGNYRNLHQYDPVHFKADHPFLYFVIDSEIHVTLMAGKIVNPINSRIS